MHARDLEAAGEPEARAPRARVGDARDGPVAVALESDGRGASVRQRLLRADEEAQEDLAQAGVAAVDVKRLAAVVLANLEALVCVRAANELDSLLGEIGRASCREKV